MRPMLMRGNPDHRAWIQQARLQSDEAERQAEGSSAAATLTGAAVFCADHFPGYELQREIHRGAQGVVYRAIQRSTRRVVAVKVLREGPFAGPHDRLRFEREVQVLAQLRHPDIVAIHDSGEAAGHFYLVMDFIDGRPLDPRAAAEGGLTGALRFFVRICEAVNAAHLRGVMHRDLKPGNILVDAEGAPHVVDFGLAKFTEAAGAGEGSSAAPTLTGQFVGSLPWCSPEQAEGGEIDIRTDVYSLGVLLYQILTGAFPYPVTGRVGDVLQRVRTQVPVRPRALRRDIDDEIETILLKCLQKEPERRSRSAGELARDLRRYLDGEAIVAKRDSFSYLLRKGLMRHRATAAIWAGFLLLITIGLITTFALWRSAAGARDRATTAEQRATGEREVAQAEAAKAGAVKQFLSEVLAAGNPWLSNAEQARQVTVLETLDRAVKELDAGSLKDQPEIHAAVRLTIAECYSGLGRTAESRRQAELAVRLNQEALGVDHSEVVKSMLRLALAAHDNGDADAPQIAGEALSIARRSHPGDHLDVAECLLRLGQVTVNDGPQSEALLREALAMFRRLLGDEDERVARTLRSLASTLVMHHQPEKMAEAETCLRTAEQIFRRRLGDRHAHVARTLQDLADLLHMRRDFDAAEKAYLAALDIYREGLGLDHPDTLICLANLAQLYQFKGQHDRCAELCAELLEGSRRTYGPHHDRTFDKWLWYARAVRMSGDLTKAEAVAREILAEVRAAGRDADLMGAKARCLLAGVLVRAGRFSEVEPLVREVLAFPEEILPTEHANRADANILLGRVLAAGAQYGAAEEAFLTGHELYQRARTFLSRDDRREFARVMIDLYEAWHIAQPDGGYDARAAEWRARLEELTTQPTVAPK